MTTYFVAFLVSMATCALLTPLILRAALASDRLDVPNERSVHVQPIPRLGGIAIVAAFYAPVVGLMLVDAGVGEEFFAQRDRVLGLFLGGLTITALGLYDDLRGSGAPLKLSVQVGVGILMYHLGYRIDVVANPFGGTLELGILALPATLLWFVGVINSVNLIDGLDGLASGIALIAVMALFVLARTGEYDVPALLCICMAGALVGFLFYNFNPARIFMGDTGSLFIGFVLAAFSLQASLKGPTTVVLTVPMLVLGVPILDAGAAIVRRRRWGKHIFRADREHIHHRLLGAGYSHRQSVLMLYGASGALAGVALVIRFSGEWIRGLLLVVVAVFVYVLMRLLTTRYLEDPNHQRIEFRSTLSRAEIAEHLRELDETSSLREVADLLDLFAEEVELQSFDLLPGSDPQQPPVYSWETGHARAGRFVPYRTYEIPLGDPDQPLARLLLAMRANRLSQVLERALPWEIAAPRLARILPRHNWRDREAWRGARSNEPTVSKAVSGASRSLPPGLARPARVPEPAKS